MAATDTPAAVPAATDVPTALAEILGRGAPLRETLDALVHFVESSTPSGMIGSILILDPEGRLRHGAGPSLPEEYNAAIDGIAIGPEVGSCGTAAFHGRTVSVYDIENDALWKDFRDLALRHGLRACWSTPIRSADGRIVGTFANYYKVVRDPSPVDVGLTDRVMEAAATVIQRERQASR